MMPYERFEAWKLCDELALAVYRVTQAFPKHELYGLTAQARRAAFSAAVNIAEGSAKPGPRERRCDWRGGHEEVVVGSEDRPPANSWKRWRATHYVGYGGLPVWFDQLRGLAMAVWQVR